MAIWRKVLFCRALGDEECFGNRMEAWWKRLQQWRVAAGEIVASGANLPADGMYQSEEEAMALSRFLNVLRSIPRICAARVLLPLTLARTLRICSAST